MTIAGSLLCAVAVLATFGLTTAAVGTAVMAPAQYPDPRAQFAPQPPANAPATITMRSPDGALIMPHARRVPGK